MKRPPPLNFPDTEDTDDTDTIEVSLLTAGLPELRRQAAERHRPGRRPLVRRGRRQEGLQEVGGSQPAHGDHLIK